MTVFNIVGKVVNSITKKGIKGLKVEAWDKDLLVNDLVGSAITGEGGVFRIQFNESYFKELFLDRRPDLFFRVFKESQLIKSTEDSVLWNVDMHDIEQTIEVEGANDMTTHKANAAFIRQRGSEVFKFITLRPFQRQDEASIQKKKVPCYEPIEEKSDFHQALFEAKTNPPEGAGPREAMMAVAQDFIASDLFINDIDDLWKPGDESRSEGPSFIGSKSALGEIEEWYFQSRKPISHDQLLVKIKEIYQADDLNSIVEDPEFQNDRSRLRDSIMALAIIPSHPYNQRDQLVNALRLCRVTERLAENDPDLMQPYDIDRAVKSPVVLPPDIFPLPPATLAQAETPTDQNGEQEQEHEQLSEKRIILRTAIAELAHLKPGDYLSPPRQIKEAPDLILKKTDIKKLSTSSKTVLEELDIDLDKETIPEIIGVLDEEVDKAEEAKASEHLSTIEELSDILSNSLAPSTDRLVDIDLTAIQEAWQPWTVKQAVIERLRETTRQAIQELGFDLCRDSVPDVINALEEELARIGALLYIPLKRKKIIRHGISNLEFLPGLEVSPWSPEDLEPIRVPHTKGLVMPIGIGEYNVVRQTLLKYEPGEVAHIENVLRGEYKERIHRRLRRLEEEVTYEEERKAVTEKDLQSADRFELKRETSETIKEEHKAQAGVTVKYDGPSVDVEAKAGYTYTHAKDQAKKTAVSYARDVTERSLSRLEEKVREVRIEKTIEEFEETNTHGIDNKDKPDHAVGIYRWVDKIYEAQVINYGQRLFFDFVVPEPAAFYLYALTHGSTTDLEEPVPPLVDENGDPCGEDNTNARSLKPDDILPDNYMTWISQYEVSGVKPPPTFEMVKGHSFAQSPEKIGEEDGEDKEKYLISSQTVPIPEGYRAFFISVDLSHPRFMETNLSIAGDNSKPGIDHFDPDIPVMYQHDDYRGRRFPLRELSISHLSDYRFNDTVSSIKVPSGWAVFATEHGNFGGSRWYITRDVNKNELKRLKLHDNITGVEVYPPADLYKKHTGLGHLNYIGEGGDQTGIPISVAIKGSDGYVMNVNLWCRRTDEHLIQWQLDSYDAIIQAYLSKKAEYEEKVAMAAIQEGISISGRNPKQNREIEETELKRWALSMITGQHFELFNAMQTDRQGYPGVDFVEADAEGPYIQFFEHALEWPLMTYVFYPYFWGKREANWEGGHSGPSWVDKITSIQDVDPLFEKYLKAGAARVKVPVRPGFEEAIAHYFATTEIWNGSEKPTLDEDLYLSMVEEIQQQQGAYVEKSEGTLSVDQGSTLVVGTDTNFQENDVDREIYIESKRYVIAEVQDAEHLALTESYRGETSEYARYYIGARLVGGPWEVRVPTSLVHLQQDATLPDFIEENDL